MKRLPKSTMQCLRISKNTADAMSANGIVQAMTLAMLADRVTAKKNGSGEGRNERVYEIRFSRIDVKTLGRVGLESN